MRRVTRLAVVAIWIGLLIALVRSQPGAPPAEQGAAPAPHPAAPPSAGEETWTGLYMHGHKVGYAHSRITPQADGYRVEDTSIMRLTVLDTAQRIRAVIDADAAPDWSVRRFSVTLDTALGAFEVAGTVTADRLELQMRSGEETTTQRLPLSGPLYLPSAARATLRGDALRIGASHTLRVFDPSAFEQQPMTLTVVGRETIGTADGAQPTWKVQERFRNIETTVWLDDAGRAVREEGPMGLLSVREPMTVAVGEGWGDAPFDLMEAVAVRPATPIAAPRSLARLRLRIRDLDPAAVPDDHRQVRQDATLTVQRETLPDSTYALPYAGDQWHAELANSPFLQLDHPAVQAAARAAAGTEPDPRRAAVALRRWVFEALDKQPAATIPNAVQILQTRTGDCNEHAVLFAALARAVGLPARVVAGLVYADGVFLYHAWNEVWLGTQWVSVDPAFDQMPADATHIKLVEGGPEAHAALVPIIGRLQLDVLNATPSE